jgi:isochorismate synthase
MCLASTIRRGETAEQDRLLGEALLNNPKERAEHDVVVRALRSGLAELCEEVAPIGTPVLLKVRNVQHLLTTIVGRVTEGRDLLDLVERLHPTPAVGGAPRERALALIRSIEQLDRGWYAGPIGWLDARGEGEFSVALRSALLRGAEASLFAGCGIVADSDPAAEYEESRWKLRPVLAALGDEA